MSNIRVLKGENMTIDVEKYVRYSYSATVRSLYPNAKISFTGHSLAL